MFAARTGNPYNISLLKSIVAYLIYTDLPRKYNQRISVIIGIGYTCYGVSCSGAGSHQRNTCLACHTCIAFCCVDSCLLMTYKIVFNLRTIIKCFINSKDNTARITKYFVYSLFF